MSYKILLRLLSVIFILGIIAHLLHFGIIVRNNIIVKEPYINNEESESGASYSLYPKYAINGYPIPIRLSVDIPDTVFSIEGLRNDRIIKNSWPSFRDSPIGNDMGQRIQSYYDTISVRDTAIYALVSKKPGDYGFSDTTFSKNPPFDWMLNYEKEKSPIDLVSIINIEKSSVNIKPKNQIQFWVLFLKTHVFSLILIYVFYQLLRSVNRLSKSLSFSDNLAKRLKRVGYALVAYTLLQYILSRIILGWYNGHIRLTSAYKYNELYDSIILNLFGKTEFNHQYIIAGIFLIVLAVLIRKSVKIEEDWSLTI